MVAAKAGLLDAGRGPERKAGVVTIIMVIIMNTCLASPDEPSPPPLPPPFPHSHKRLAMELKDIR